MKFQDNKRITEGRHNPHPITSHTLHMVFYFGHTNLIEVSDTEKRFCLLFGARIERKSDFYH